MLLNRILTLLNASIQHHKPSLDSEDMPKFKQERLFSTHGFEEPA